MPPVAYWPLGYNRACGREDMMPGSTTHGLPLVPFWVVGTCWVGLHFMFSINIALITLAGQVLVHLTFPRCNVVSV